MLPAGTTLTLDVSGTTNVSIGAGASADAIRTTVVDALTAYFDVYIVTVNTPSIVTDILNNYFVNFAYTAVVTIGTRVDYNSLDDAESIVANAFYQAVNAVPTVVARNSDQPTAAPATNEITPGVVGAGAAAVLQPVTSLVNLLIIGIVVLVVAVAFSPTGRVAAGRL